MTTPETVAPNRFAEMFGYPKRRAVTKLKNSMTPFVQEFIQHAPFAVLATSDRDGRCDASPKGGKPGFVRVLDERHLLMPDVAGNKLFQLYQTDENAKHLQGIIIEVEEAYAHCPRALKFSKLWDVEEISTNVARRPISDRPYDS